MPLYEYLSESDGTVIQLLRPMADADKPVEDPDNKGRTFIRTISTFTPKSGSSHASPQPAPGCCPCGRTSGGCRSQQ
jgi:hypothetical protein